MSSFLKTDHFLKKFPVMAISFPVFINCTINNINSYRVSFLGSSTLSRRVGGTTRPVGRGTVDEVGGGTDFGTAFGAEVSAVTVGLFSTV